MYVAATPALKLKPEDSVCELNYKILKILFFLVALVSDDLR